MNGIIVLTAGMYVFGHILQLASRFVVTGDRIRYFSPWMYTPRLLRISAPIGFLIMILTYYTFIKTYGWLSGFAYAILLGVGVELILRFLFMSIFPLFFLVSLICGPILLAIWFFY